jgi:hypothetical protein
MYDDLPPLSPSEVTLMRARRSYLLAEVAVINERLARLRISPEDLYLDLSKFDPAWKAGSHLSARGKLAILSAFDRRMSQAEVAKLFQLSLTGANNWHRRWKLQRMGDTL